MTSTSPTSLEQRLSEASKIKKKYPDKIPVIIKNHLCVIILTKLIEINI